MVSIPSENVWIEEAECPCGYWKCFLAYEGEGENTNILFQTAIKIILGRQKLRKERLRLSQHLGVHKRDFVCYRAGFALAGKKPTGDIIEKGNLFGADVMRRYTCERK
ncbi:hypothetical protein ACH5RR_017428 [Cinchona calisaya]|uniref:Uncharacterized protein n=1 Tax=Cinchona calisaya TaxID=153742 RepID=A0ABD2ZJC3_9GENT